MLFIDPRPSIKRKPFHDFIWGIEYKENHRIIGIIEIFDVENDRVGSVGYRINPSYWNRGICSEALNRIINFVYSKTQLDRLHAEADVNNIASNLVLKKCGFQLKGSIRHGKMGT